MFAPSSTFLPYLLLVFISLLFNSVDGQREEVSVVCELSLIMTLLVFVGRYERVSIMY